MINIVSAKRFISEQHFDCDITPRRRVEFYELELYNRGNGITCINGVRLKHKTNRFICAKPGQIRFSHGSFECESIHFLCSDLETRKLLNSLPDFANVDYKVAEKIRKIMAEIYGNFSNQLLSCSAVFNILSAVFGQNGETNTDKPDCEKYYDNIMIAKDFIDNNFSEQITLRDIAKNTYLSPNFLRDEFEKFVGISPHKYLSEIRLSNACKLLKSTRQSLADIAYECGFKSQSYMNYVFKKEFHITPNDYRHK